MPASLRRRDRTRSASPTPSAATTTERDEYFERLEAELDTALRRAEEAENQMPKAIADVKQQLQDEFKLQLNSLSTTIEQLKSRVLEAERNERDAKSRADIAEEREHAAKMKAMEARDREAEADERERNIRDREARVLRELQKANERAFDAETRAEQLNSMRRSKTDLNDEKGEMPPSYSWKPTTKGDDVPQFYQAAASKPPSFDRRYMGALDVPMPSQNAYDGRQPWESFIKPFKGLAMACQWSEEETRFRLVSSLKDEAATYAFTELSDEVLKSATLLEKALEDRFGERRSANSYLAQLESRKMGYKETLTEYTADIRRLVVKGYPTADVHTRETIALRHFVKGLNDQQMVLAVGMKDPRTIEEARTAAETYLGLREETGKGQSRPLKAIQKTNAESNDRSPAATAYVPVDHFNSIVASFEKRLDELLSVTKSSQQRKSYGYNGGERQYNGSRPFNRYRRPGAANEMIKCYNCDKEGHIARNCPERAPDTGSTGGKSSQASTSNHTQGDNNGGNTSSEN